MSASQPADKKCYVKKKKKKCYGSRVESSVRAQRKEDISSSDGDQQTFEPKLWTVLGLCRPRWSGRVLETGVLKSLGQWRTGTTTIISQLEKLTIVSSSGSLWRKCHVDSGPWIHGPLQPVFLQYWVKWRCFPCSFLPSCFLSFLTSFFCLVDEFGLDVSIFHIRLNLTEGKGKEKKKTSSLLSLNRI